MDAPEEFMLWFRKNYPGPDTIIHKPDWHAPKIYRAAIHAAHATLRAQAARIAELRSEVERCHGRLEITHEWADDGTGTNLTRAPIPMDERTDYDDAVSCRDATIGLMDERIAELEAEVAQLREELGKARREERINIQTVAAFEAGAERAEAKVARMREAREAEDMLLARAAYDQALKDHVSGRVARDPRVILAKTLAALQEKPHEPDCP